MIADRYYYSRLSKAEQKIYSALYQGVQKFEQQIYLPGANLDQETIHKIFHAVTEDNPHLYYFNQTCMDIGSNPLGMVLMPQYFCSQSQVETYNGRVQECVNRIVVELDLVNASALEKEKRIHDYMATNIVYDEEALHITKVDRLVAAHSIIGVFARQRAVCEGIAKATKLLLNTVNIPCIVVSGTAALEQQDNHSWNIVKIDDAAYHLDMTWDVSNSRNGHINYDYFNLPDEAVSLDHFDYAGVPECISWAQNYFVLNKMMFKSMRQLERYLLTAIRKGNMEFYFRMDSGYRHTMQQIVEAATRFALSEVSKDEYSWTASSSFNEQQRTGRISLKIQV
jgi:hypothetical protein